MPFIGLIKIFLQFRLFFAKIDKIAYTCNYKDAKHSNRNNLICVQDIDTNFACIVGFSGSAISNMLPKISRELPWQPNLEKNEPKLYKTSCLDRIVRRRNVVNGSEDMFL